MLPQQKIAFSLHNKNYLKSHVTNTRKNSNSSTNFIMTEGKQAGLIIPQQFSLKLHHLSENSSDPFLTISNASLQSSTF
jgi:phage gp29-like protein